MRFSTKAVLLLAGILLIWAAIRQLDRKVFDPRNEHGMTPLMVAADRGDAAEVRRLAKKGRVDARVPSNDLAVFIAFLSWMQTTPHHDVGWTALIYAARAGCLDCVGTLLDAGADVNATGRDGSTALLEATQKDHPELVEFLVSKGADARNPRLVYAALGNGKHALLQRFLDLGADPDAKVEGTTLYYSKATPLLVAVHRKDAEAVRILLDAKAHPEPRDPQNNWTALRFARREGLAEIEHLLRRAGAKDDGSGEERLLEAMRSRDVTALRAALEAGANPNSNDPYGNPLICEAAERGQNDLVRALLEHGADVNARNNYGAQPLWLAISFGHPETAELLIESGADIHDRKNNPLSIAVQRGNRAITQLLLDRKADANMGNGSLVRAAAKNGDFDMLKLLIAHGGNVRASNEHGEHALHMAAYRGSPELLKFLIDAGLPLEQRNLNGGTPLLSAAAVGNLEGVKVLLAAGADPNVKDSDGKSVLQHARNYPEVQAVLRQAGAR